MAPSLELVSDPAPDLHDIILEGLRAYNRTLFGAGPFTRDLAVVIREPDGRAIGGLWGRTAGGWLAIELIFVPEHLRGGGVASRLVAMAEDEARRRECHSAWIDTLNPAALRLYEKLGYVRFGELQNYPVGYSRVFLQKTLAPREP